MWASWTPAHQQSPEGLINPATMPNGDTVWAAANSGLEKVVMEFLTPPSWEGYLRRLRNPSPPIGCVPYFWGRVVKERWVTLVWSCC